MRADFDTVLSLVAFDLLHIDGQDGTGMDGAIRCAIDRARCAFDVNLEVVHLCSFGSERCYGDLAGSKVAVHGLPVCTEMMLARSNINGEVRDCLGGAHPLTVHADAACGSATASASILLKKLNEDNLRFSF